MVTDLLRDELSRVCPLASDSAAWEQDWTGRVRGRALAVAVPGDVAQVAEVLRTCAAAGVSVTVAGGRTGLVAGAVPSDTVVLSTQRLSAMQAVEAGSSVVGAGVSLARVQAHARASGWDYGVDFAARDSATIGGTVATNAGGIHVVAHGTTRAQVLGVEAVLADGSVVRRMSGLAKDATGYDLAQLLVGSEGTLGVVTAVRLRLVPPAPVVETALVGVESVAAAVALVQQLRGQVDGLRAAELVLPEGIALVREAFGLGAPLRQQAPAYVVVEAAGRRRPGLLEALQGPAEVLDAAVAADAADAARLWAYRERMTEAVARLATRLGPPHKLDVSLPLPALDAFVADLPGVTEGCVVHVWGHVGDGNLHVNVLGPAPDDDAVDDAVLRLAASYGGSIGAEHGIGRAKRRWLHLSRSPAEIAAMRAVKRALDPAGLLGPGVLLPDETPEDGTPGDQLPVDGADSPP